MADEPTSLALLAGRYQHVRELGRGGAGRVVLARDTLEDRPVALKIVPPEQAERLRWELELGSRLRHPHIAEMFELLVLERAMGEPFHIPAGSSVLVEEAIEGGAVQDFARAARDRVPTVLRLGSEIASALAAIHALGWVHGDVKPANVLVRTDGRAVLVDFGLSGPPMDADGRVRGTLGYLAPEAWTGARSVATDVYALGATLARLLDDDVDASALPDDASWPDAVRVLLASMLQPDPVDRLSDAREVIASIDDVRRRLGEPIQTHALPSRSSAELALRVQSLPWIGDAERLAALVDRLEQGGAVRVGGPIGAGRTRFVREAVRVFQRRRAERGRPVPTYVRADELRDPPLGPAVVHLLTRPDEAWITAQQNAAAVAGHSLSIVVEGHEGDVELSALQRDAFARLVEAILERAPDDAELERAYSATAGLAGRACTLASEAYARDAEPFANIDADTTGAASEIVTWIAQRGGSVRRIDVEGRLDGIASLERAGLGWRAGDRFRLRRDVHRAALESEDVRGDAQETSDEPLANAYLSACAGTDDAPRRMAGVIRDALERGDPREAERIATDATTLLGDVAPLRLLLAEALRTQARYDDALAVLMDGSEHDAMRAEILRRGGRADEARAILERLDPTRAPITRALVEGAHPDAPTWTRAELRAWSLLGDERWEEALDQVRRGLESLAGQSSRDARRARARLRSTEGSIAHAAGRPKVAAIAYEAARKLAAELGEAHLEATSAANAGAVQLDLGDLGEGLRAVEEGARRLLRLRRDRDAARALVNLASGALWIGDDARAMRAAEQAERAAERAGDDPAAAYAWLVRLELALRRGKLDEARALIARPPSEGRARARAAALWAAHDASTARTLLREGDELSRAIAEARLQLAEGHAPSSITLAPSTWEERLQLGLLELDASEHDPRRNTRARAGLRRHLDRAAETLSPAQRRMMRRVASYERAWSTMPSAEATREEGRWRRLVDRAKRLTAERRVRRIREMVVQTAVELVDAERGFWVQRRSDGELRIVARDAWDDAAEGEVSRSVVSRAMDARRTVRAVDALEDERLTGARSVHAMALRSVLCVPLRHGSAALYLDDRLRPAAFSDDDARLLEDLADLASIALAGAERLRSERSAVRRLEQAQQELEVRVESQREQLEGLRRNAGVVALSASMRRTMEIVSRVAPTDAPLLLHGESGVGKERIAHAVHAMSPRREGPFIPVACAAIPDTLLESTLFGHERGAFTGAGEMRRGVFELAEGGTLFLDEIGEMPPSMQAKLLRVVQEGELRRVGGESVRATNVRIVTATHRDLRAMIDQETFREDLYYRLAVVRVEVPPLRERLEDLPRLVEAILAELDPGHPKPSAEAMGQLMSHAWPGNVRELRNVLERALVTATGAITAEDLGLGREQAGTDLKSQLEALERRLIRGAMLETGGNQTKAAELLGVSRYGLQKKLKRLGL